MVSMRIISSDGRHWLKIVDGWICEEVNGNMCVLPFNLKTSEKSQSTQLEELHKENVSNTVYSRRDFLQRERNVAHFPVSNTEQASTNRDRLQELQDLQNNIQEMSKSIHELSKAIIDSQKILSTLIKGKFPCCAS